MKTKLILLSTLCFIFTFSTSAIASPSIYPTGVTIYKPDKAWPGYTVISTGWFAADKDTTTYLIDMNGNVVNHWPGLYGAWSSKILPGGYIMGTSARSTTEVFETLDLIQMDWDGNIVWKFDKGGQVKVGDKMVWSARHQHDYQREGNPVGYYAPGMNMLVDKGKTLLVSSKVVNKPEITDKPISDSRAIEIDWNGKILWEWAPTDHWDELGLSEETKNAFYRTPGADWKNEMKLAGYVKPLYLNNINWLGPNRWYDQGDERFHPENIIADFRNFNMVFIISKKTGGIVWKVGPYFDSSPALKKMGQIVGPHHAHLIPKGLPGEGNILVFDNGGDAGFGAPNPNAPSGVNNARSSRSRVLEFNPVTLEVVWQYEAPGIAKQFTFFSPYCSGAQRFLNGNTLIDEACTGRLFEVTPENEIVWEVVRPPQGVLCEVFRPVRCPYDWVPQLPKPVEKAVIPPKMSDFRIAPLGQEVPSVQTHQAPPPAGSNKPQGRPAMGY